VLAALREIYDGAWTRHLGTDGGRTLHWEGKLGLIGGCTPTIDRHHAVLSALGDRFLLLRLPSVDAEEVGARAMAHLGHEPAMRAELAAAAGRVLDAADLAAAGRTLDPDEHRRLLDLAIFAVRARSAVERDGYSQEVLAIPEAEGPPRFLLALRRLMGGLESIGCGPEDVWHVLTAVAVDSMPATRRRLLEALMVTGRARTGELAAAADLPTKTAARHLEDLALLGLATRTKTSTATNAPDEWTPSDLARRYWPRSATEIPKEEQRTGTAAGGPFTHPSPQKKECLSYSPSPAAELLCEVCGETPGDNAPECPACAEVVPA
jgi:hypothetical protein